MSLEDLQKQKRLRAHETSRDEIAGLFKIAAKDMQDTSVDLISSDRRFATAYNAALQLSTIVLHCHGYRTRGGGHHAATFAALGEIGIPELSDYSAYFDGCRSKRNITDYDRAGEITESEAEELLAEASAFHQAVKIWLKDHHPDLSPFHVEDSND